jgi:hypothetical protein
MSSHLASARAFLDSLALQQVPHNTGNLHGHLLRTGQRLKQWGFDEDVCAAGMFHSVLGTQHFSRRSIQLHDLPALETAIGPRAAHLVKIFSVAIRPRSLVQGLVTGSVELLHGGRVPIDPNTASDLVSIEFANLLDQDAIGGFIQELCGAPDLECAHVLSPPVMRSWGPLVFAMHPNVAIRRA